MRIGQLAEDSICTHYRCLTPLRAMERLGHEIVLTGQESGDLTYERLRGCDVIHAYRLLEPRAAALLERLLDDGAAFVRDTDDDLEALPRESPAYKLSGGRAGMRQVFRQLVAMARRADVMTTTTSRSRGSTAPPASNGSS